MPVAAVVHPLVISGCTHHLTSTRRILEHAGSVINSKARATVLCLFLENRTPSSLCPYLFADHQEPVDWRIKIKADVSVGLIGSATALLYDDYTQPVLAFSFIPFVKDIIGFLVNAVLVISHYPVNGVWIVFLISVIFVLFWPLLQIHGITVDMVGCGAGSAQAVCPVTRQGLRRRSYGAGEVHQCRRDARAGFSGNGASRRLGVDTWPE